MASLHQYFHVHPHLTLVMLFLLGQALYILKRAAMAIRSPLNPATSRRSFLARNWDVILIRVGAAQTGFWLWISYPDGLSRIAQVAGVHLDLTIPAKPVVALVSGVCSDAILDWIAEKIPALKRELPAVPVSRANQANGK